VPEVWFCTLVDIPFINDRFSTDYKIMALGLESLTIPGAAVSFFAAVRYRRKLIPPAWQQSTHKRPAFIPLAAAGADCGP
jgi:hypothetical protein